ncbi:tail fiber domain-containing protein [Mucilaginibacter sp. PAMB04168]|uniref:tail fiber domain-containing protein n=1 Tax=Mucilaginibacter sp. PAMB04168 TaxID=3138567 RepID=UPI0031F711EE
MKTSKFVIALLALASFTTVGYAQTKVSESQLKENTTPITGALATVNLIEPITYQYNQQAIKNTKLPTGTQYGFNAASVQSALPGLVKTESILYPAGKNQYRSADISKVDVQSLIPVLLGAIKEQQQQIDALKAEVQSLKQNRTTSAAVR